MVTDGGPPPDSWLAELRAVSNAATPGPWYQGEDYGHIWAKGEGLNEYGEPNDTLLMTDCKTDADGRFITWAREAVPALLSENEQLRARVAELERRASE